MDLIATLEGLTEEKTTMAALNDPLFGTLTNLDDFKEMIKEAAMPAAAGFLGSGLVTVAFKKLMVEAEDDYHGADTVAGDDGKIHRPFFNAPWKRGLAELGLGVVGGALMWGYSQSGAMGLFGAMAGRMGDEGAMYLLEQLDKPAAGLRGHPAAAGLDGHHMGGYLGDGVDIREEDRRRRPLGEGVRIQEESGLGTWLS